MEQDERAVLDPCERDTEQGEQAPAAVLAGEVAGAEEGDQERVSETLNPAGDTASESAKKQDLEEPSPQSEKVAASSGTVSGDHREAFANNIAAHFEFRSASRGRNQAGPTKFVAAGAAEGAGSGAPVLGASSSSAPVTGTHEDASAVADHHQGAAPGDDQRLKRACSAPRATVAIAHASPPDSYRPVPRRSRKQTSPKRFVTDMGASTSAAAPPAGDPPVPSASVGSALQSSSSSGIRLGSPAASDATASTGITDALASSSTGSYRPPSRGRKQPRPEHFIPEEAEASASAKARRSDIVLDRFLSTLVHGTPPSDSEWVRIRDASRHAARALSRLGCASPPPGEPDGRGRFYGVLAVLGASLALSVASCVLFYIVGQSSEPGSSGEMPDE